MGRKILGLLFYFLGGFLALGTIGSMLRFLTGNISETLIGKIEDLFGLLLIAGLSYLFFKQGNNFFQEKPVDEIDQIGKNDVG